MYLADVSPITTDWQAFPFDRVTPTIFRQEGIGKDDGLQVSSLAAAVRGGRMFHTAITTAVLQISHREKKAFRISTDV